MKFLQTILMLPLISCAATPGPLGEQTLDISGFDFSTPLTTLLPERYINSEYGANWYNIPSADDGTNLMQRDTTVDWHTDEPLWIEYRRRGVNSEDKYLSFEDQIFNAANFMTTPEGRIMLVGGYAWHISQEDSDALIERITKKYGKPKHRPKSFMDQYDLYTWTLEDRTVKYAVVSTDESNVLKMKMSHNEQGELTDLSEGERESYLNGYIFVIDAPWVEKILSAKQASGDFVYCR